MQIEILKTWIQWGIAKHENSANIILERNSKEIISRSVPLVANFLKDITLVPKFAESQYQLCLLLKTNNYSFLDFYRGKKYQ